VSGAEISIRRGVLTRAVRVRLALHIRTLTKFNLANLHLYSLFIRKEGKDIKVKTRAEL